MLRCVFIVAAPISEVRNTVLTSPGDVLHLTRFGAETRTCQPGSKTPYGQGALRKVCFNLILFRGVERGEKAVQSDGKDLRKGDRVKFLQQENAELGVFYLIIQCIDFTMHPWID